MRESERRVDSIEVNTFTLMDGHPSSLLLFTLEPNVNTLFVFDIKVDSTKQYNKAIHDHLLAGERGGPLSWT